jgi:hypothetical protein
MGADYGTISMRLLLKRGVLQMNFVLLTSFSLWLFIL